MEPPLLLVVRSLTLVVQAFTSAAEVLDSADQHLSLVDRSLKSGESSPSPGETFTASVDDPLTEVNESLKLFVGDTRSGGTSPLLVAGPLSSKCHSLLSKNYPLRSRDHGDRQFIRKLTLRKL